MPQASPVILRLWAALLLLSAVVGGPIPIFTFGVVAFATLLAFWLRDSPKRGLTEHRLSGLVLLLCVVWFGVNLILELRILFGGAGLGRLQAFTLALAFLFPPLILHGYHAEGVQAGVATRWGVVVPITYGVALGASLYVMGMVVGLYGFPGNAVFASLTLLLFALFGVATILGGVALARTPVTAGRKASSHRRLHLALLALMLVLFAVLFWEVTTQTTIAEVGSVLARSLPIFFLFVASYFERRFQFFDVFVKKATLCFLGLFLLFAFFRLILPSVADLPAASRPWMLALAVLPLVLAGPWLGRRLDAWLDRVWLGRRYATAEAVEFALEGLRHATSERELVEQGEARLATILQASVRICVGDGDRNGRPMDWTVRQEIPIPAYGRVGGTILLGDRRNQTPFFAQDLTLVRALATVMAYLLENFRLQQRKQLEERRSQELRLHASRSELKALRAQINPHFLFNALNSIAGLIPDNPALAESTIEELAEVFRYTLSRSDSEWVRVGEELDFVAAYLGVERARFGDRLQVRLSVEPGLEDASIPMMMIQTLVENAVKHGLSEVKGVGRIRIEVASCDERIEIQVADNGPEPSGDHTRQQADGGFGLASVRRRLEGYFGEAASFQLTRDAAGAETVARIRIPRCPAAGPPQTEGA